MSNTPDSGHIGHMTKQSAFRGSLLILGCVLAAVTETLAGNALPFARLGGMLGDIYAAPDMFTWLDTGYTAAKIFGFIAAPLLLMRFTTPRVLQAAGAGIALACGLMLASTDVFLLTGIRALQGLSGGVLIVAAQYALFLRFAKRMQSLLQGVFAMGVVTAPIALAPFMLGWLVEFHAWEWIFAVTFGLAVFMTVLFFCGFPELREETHAVTPDWTALFLFFTCALFLTYCAQQASRWNGFDSPVISGTAFLALFSLVLLCVRICGKNDQSILYLPVFSDKNFILAFIISFVAGYVLLGSSYLVTNFCFGIASFNAVSLGKLLLMSGSFAFISVTGTALILYRYQIEPFMTIPVGVVFIMSSLWVISSMTNETGADSLFFPLLVRAIGFGFLLLSLTLVAFKELTGRALMHGIALFCLGRQTGGLLSTGILQRYLDHQFAYNLSQLATHIVEGDPLTAQHMEISVNSLKTQGMEPVNAYQAALALLKGAVNAEAYVIAYNEAFFLLFMLLLCAVPIMATTRILLFRKS